VSSLAHRELWKPLLQSPNTDPLRGQACAVSFWMELEGTKISERFALRAQQPM
jgi:hypothetical protein